MRRLCLVLSALALSANAHAAGLEGLGSDLLNKLKSGTGQQNAPASQGSTGTGLASLSDADTVKGLKEALTQGADSAVGKLGRTDGFLGNNKVKIPLPGGLQDVEGVLRTMGQGKVIDDLVVTMNRAAEAAVPQAKPLLVDAIKKMTVQDAKNVLTGGDDAATQYFRKATEPQLHDNFLPIVSKTVSKLRVTDKYNSLAGKAAQFGLIEKKQASMQEYVTQKTLDGLFVMIADEERAIRQNPAERTGYWVKKVFGTLGK
jgi:hypothetical protein